jgi:hypothetical protein
MKQRIDKWFEFYEIAIELLDKKNRGNPLSVREALLVDIASECHKAGMGSDQWSGFERTLYKEVFDGE